MAHEYKPIGGQNPPDPKRCKAAVWTPRAWHAHQCPRKPWKDGWCKQHHPDTVKTREEAYEKRYKEKQERHDRAMRSAYGRKEYERGWNEAVEKCAQRCEERAREWHESHLLDKADEAECCADSIRELTKPNKEGE